MEQATEDQVIGEPPAADTRGLPIRREVLLRGAMLSAAAMAVPFASGCARAVDQSSAAGQQGDKQPGPSL
jgi:hypothetical protein